MIPDISKNPQQKLKYKRQDEIQRSASPMNVDGLGSQCNLGQQIVNVPANIQPNVNRNYEQKYGVSKVPEALKRQLKNRGNNNQPLGDQNIMTQFKQNVIIWIMSDNQCQICQGFPKQQKLSLSNCWHTYCKSCLEGYVQYKIQSSQQIRCPYQHCSFVLGQNNEIFQGISEDLKKKYFKQKIWRQTQRNPNKRLCPCQNCVNGVVDLLADPPVCNSCHKTFCKQCELEAHQGPCENKFQQMFIGWKKCPKCKMFIEKKQGCNHIKCNCEHQFCYVCLANWDKDNSHDQCQGIAFPSFQIEQYQTANCVPQNYCLSILLGIFLILCFPIVIIVALLLFLLIVIVWAIIGAIALPIMACFGTLGRLGNIGSNGCQGLLFLCAFIAIVGVFVGAVVGAYCSYFPISELFKFYCKLMASCFCVPDQ